MTLARVLPLETPFKTAFAHARARRKTASAVLVQLDGEDGQYGYGEGCPRDYVTGESLEGALSWLKACAPDIVRQVADLDGLRDFIARHEAEIDANPSAFCALELALIDLMARRKGQSVERFLGLDISPPLKVTAVLGSDNPVIHGLQVWRFRRPGLTDAKLKLGADSGRNRHRCQSLARHFRLRLDGNNLWPDVGTAISGLKLLIPYVWAVEEPIMARDFKGLIAVQAATGLKVILDESLLNRHDLEAFLALSPDPDAFIVNLRVSKGGGLLRSLALYERLKAHGFGVIIGAQVGETSLLARAGLIVAGTVRPLMGYEGAYGTHLLSRDAFAPSVTFSERGIIDPGALNLGPTGFGLSPTPEITQLFANADPPR